MTARRQSGAGALFLQQRDRLRVCIQPDLCADGHREHGVGMACLLYTSVASLFLKVGKDEFDKKVKNIYTRAAEQLSSQLGYHIPVVVANDGDVSALAGAMGLGENGIMGIAMRCV